MVVVSGCQKWVIFRCGLLGSGVYEAAEVLAVKTSVHAFYLHNHIVGMLCNFGSQGYGSK